MLADAFYQGSFIKIIPSENKILGYTTKNSGGVPGNFKNYFVIIFDKSFDSAQVWSKDHIVEDIPELQDDHVGAAIRFITKKVEYIHARVASSFISYEQAEENMKELGNDTFDEINAKGRDIWNKELSRIKVEGGTDDQIKTFYSYLYRVLLFPRKFFELNKDGNIIHYSPYSGKVLPGYMFTALNSLADLENQRPVFNKTSLGTTKKSPGCFNKFKCFIYKNLSAFRTNPAALYNCRISATGFCPGCGNIAACSVGKLHH